ncbi:MAG: hypothetical protein COV67_00235 [Nitrospinae bacterium CG11_big_fil_rev_8_21_14_0_20_56_8]|nr:MAG: hypothetical protein COV67_00235 [Nitrospinae bacterium CG11_big_fil_rev_8_21_14_0_20_56_8]
MTFFREIIPGVFTWSEFSGEKQLNFNGHFLKRQGESVLIDPPPLDEEGQAELDALIENLRDFPLKGILLTNVHHDRGSRELAKRYSVPIWIHEADKALLEFKPDATFRDGETLPCGLKVVHLRDQKSPGESAFFDEAHKVLWVGDALIGKVPGKVNLLPADKYRDVNQAKKSLAVLLGYDFDALLVGDGEPILKGARNAVAEFIEG